MEKLSRQVIIFLFLGPVFAGVIILISKWGSSSGFHESIPAEFFIDKHTNLFVLVGFTIAVLTFWCIYLQAQIYKLEKSLQGIESINHLSPSDPEGAFPNSGTKEAQ